MSSPSQAMKMERSIRPSTHRRHSCRLPPRPLLTSPNCRIHNCNSACKMATRATVRRPSRTLSTRHNRSYRPRGLDKRVWVDHLDRTRVGNRPRDRKHRSMGHIRASKVPSMVAHSSKELHRIRRPSNIREAMPAFLHRCRTSSSIRRLYRNVCPPCLHPHSRQRCKTSALRHLPHIRNMEVESTPLRTEPHHMCRGCPMAAALTSLSIHLLLPTTGSLLRPNSVKAPRASTNTYSSNNSSNSSSSTNNNNNACMRYGSGS